jgi:hypothetical protein
MQHESIWLELQTLRESHEMIDAHMSGNGTPSSAANVAAAAARAMTLLAIPNVRSAYENAASLEAAIAAMGA